MCRFPGTSLGGAGKLVCPWSPEGADATETAPSNKLGGATQRPEYLHTHVGMEYRTVVTPFGLPRLRGLDPPEGGTPNAKRGVTAAIPAKPPTFVRAVIECGPSRWWFAGSGCRSPGRWSR